MKNKYCLLIVDMLNDFVTGSLGFDASKKIIKPNKELISFAHKNRIPVIYTCDSHLENIDFEFTKWDKHAIKGKKESEIISELKPSKEDYVLYKRRYSAFFHTDLDLLLKELSVDTLIVTGLQTHICVLHTIASAFMLNFKTILAKEATMSNNIDEYHNALKYIQNIYGTKIYTNKEIYDLVLDN